jgi:hypothetical protein
LLERLKKHAVRCLGRGNQITRIYSEVLTKLARKSKLASSPDPENNWPEGRLFAGRKHLKYDTIVVALLQCYGDPVA